MVLLTFVLYAIPIINNLTLSNDTVEKYNRLEITVEITAQFQNPFDTADINLMSSFLSPSQDTWKVPGFFDGSQWKVRFAANETGNWRGFVWVDDGTGVDTSDTFYFHVVDSQNKGWLRVSIYDPHYLMYDNGESFYGIGQCRAWDLFSVPGIFDSMQLHGMNFLVYWMPHWDNMLVTMQTGYDHYDMDHAANIDKIIDSCEAHNIYLMLTIWNHDELRAPPHPWGDGAYYTENPFSIQWTVEEFFYDTLCLSYQRRLYRYIIARWGYSRAIGMWQTICEIDGTNAGEYEYSWYQFINDYFVNNDPFHHPTTADKSGDVWWPSGYSIMDITQVHSYDHALDPIGIADRLAYWTRMLWTNFSKPCVIGEFGTNDENLQPQHLHNGIWGGFSSGGAIAPLDWNDGGDWGDFSPEMYDQAKYLADFVSNIPFDKLGLDSATILTPTEFKAWGMECDSFGFLWVQDQTPGENNSGVQLEVLGILNDWYLVLFYDPWQGIYLDTIIKEVTENQLSFTLPDFSNDIAVKFKRIDYSPPNITVISPNGGERVYCDRDTILIEWSTQSTIGIDSNSIYLSTNNGESWVPIVRGLPPDSSYMWDVQCFTSDSCLIKIVAYDHFGNWGEDESDSTFSIQLQRDMKAKRRVFTPFRKPLRKKTESINEDFNRLKKLANFLFFSGELYINQKGKSHQDTLKDWNNDQKFDFMDLIFIFSHANLGKCYKPK